MAAKPVGAEGWKVEEGGGGGGPPKTEGRPPPTLPPRTERVKKKTQINTWSRSTLLVVVALPPPSPTTGVAEEESMDEGTAEGVAEEDHQSRLPPRPEVEEEAGEPMRDMEAEGMRPWVWPPTPPEVRLDLLATEEDTEEGGRYEVAAAAEGVSCRDSVLCCREEEAAAAAAAAATAAAAAPEETVDDETEDEAFVGEEATADGGGAPEAARYLSTMEVEALDAADGAAADGSADGGGSGALVAPAYM